MSRNSRSRVVLSESYAKVSRFSPLILPFSIMVAWPPEPSESPALAEKRRSSCSNPSFKDGCTELCPREPKLIWYSTSPAAIIGRSSGTYSTLVSALTPPQRPRLSMSQNRSEEHTSELQSRRYLLCRLLLEKENESTSAQRRDSRYLRAIRALAYH